MLPHNLNRRYSGQAEYYIPGMTQYTGLGTDLLAIVRWVVGRVFRALAHALFIITYSLFIGILWCLKWAVLAAVLLFLGAIAGIYAYELSEILNGR